jgi:hypothetical protein
LYIFVGPSASLFKIKSEASFFINTPPYNTFFFQDTYKFWKFGGKIGLGLAHAFSEHWIGRIETSLIIFGQGNTKTLSFRTTPSTKRQISIKPQLLDVSFSLSYGF